MRILLVDDDELMRQYLRRVLQQEPSFQIEEARDGVEAWEKLQKDPLPELCLLDIMMPRMNGLELLQKMRSDGRYQRTKVIMCTVVRDPNHVQEAITLDVSDYILKPFKNVTLVNMVRRALGITGKAIVELADADAEGTSPEDSYSHRLAMFLSATTPEVQGLADLLAQNRLGEVTESLNQIRFECRRMDLRVLERAVDDLEAAVNAQREAEVPVRLQGLLCIHRSIAEVLAKMAPDLALALQANET